MDREKDEIASALKKDHALVLEKLTQAHQNNFKDLKTKFEEKEAVIQKHQKTISTLSNEISSTNQQLTIQKGITQDIQLRVEELQAENIKLATEVKQTQLNLATSKDVVAERDALIVVLQNELVKLAQSNLRDLDEASALKLTVPPNGSHAPPLKSSARRAGDVPTSNSGTPQSVRLPSGQLSTRSANPVATSLPPNWQQLRDEQDNEYFYNSVTGASSWERPTGVGAPTTMAGAIGDWEQIMDESGQPYWLNTVTGVSQWEAPAESVGVGAIGGGGYSIEL